MTAGTRIATSPRRPIRRVSRICCGAVARCCSTIRDHRFVTAVKAVLQAALATRDRSHARRRCRRMASPSRAASTSRGSAACSRARRVASVASRCFTTISRPNSTPSSASSSTPRSTPPTGAPSTRCGRPSITRKTCGGGNRTARGADSQQVLTSVLRTADQRGLDATDVLVELLTAPTPTRAAAPPHRACGTLTR